MVSSQRKILLVEDESGIADNVVFALQQEGFSVDWVSLGGAAIERVAEENYLLVILDIGLPDFSGFEVCKAIRLNHNLPVVFLTARIEEVDRVVGLEIGADDYISKPFSPRELVARVKAILRRYNPAGISESQSKSGKTVGCFRVCEEQALIEYQGRQLNLTRFEYLILMALLTEPGRVYSREELMKSVWGRPAPSLDRSIDTHIKTLRAKLKVVDKSEVIKTHRGFGYSVVL